MALHVDLYVKINSTPDTGWTKCKDGSGIGIGFCCYFTGGNWPEGGPGYFQGKKVKTPSPLHVQIELKSTAFEITGINYTPPGGNVTAAPIGSSGKWEITDSNNDIQLGTYTVIVKETKTGGVATIHCHPGWKND